MPTTVTIGANQSSAVFTVTGKDDTLLDGSQVVTVTDLWTFERDTRSRSPNWKLVATRSPN